MSYIDKDIAIKLLKMCGNTAGADCIRSIPPIKDSCGETGKWINGVCRDCGKPPDDLRRGTELEYSYWPELPPYCPNCGRHMTLERWSNGD